MAVLNNIVQEKFGLHRGAINKGFVPNSIKAIRKAIELRPPFVEFDIRLSKDKLHTGHPPQRPINVFGNVIKLFERKRKTYPKVDIKLRFAGSTLKTIDQVLNIVEQSRIKFTLINLGKRKSATRKEVMQAEIYLVSKIIGNDAIKLNIDLGRYRSPGQPITPSINNHVKKIKNTIFSFSAEIHEENPQTIFRFAKKHGINAVVFWLKGWPDEPNPQVSEEAIHKALLLENKYPASIYFDINPVYVVKS